MIKQTYFFGFSTLLLTVALLSVPLTIAQQPDWDYCRVSAYGNNVLEEVIGDIKRMYFNVAIPPAGSNISNTIEVMDYLSGENHTVNLSTGELVLVRYDDINPTKYTLVPASEANHFVIYYEGQIRRIAVIASIFQNFHQS